MRQHPAVRAIVVARSDCVVVERYREDTSPDTLLPVESITKSVMSILVGIAIDGGLLRLDQTLPELADPSAIGRSGKNVTLRDLLTMTAGLGSGTRRFDYDDSSADVIGVILARATGNAAIFARDHLFRPIGIPSYDWPNDGEGVLRGRGGLRLSAQDMVRIGLLYLQHGEWSGKQVVSADYVAASTRRHSDGSPPLADAGYGFLWWVTKTRAGHDAYLAAGTRSQLILVIPERDLIVVLASDASIGSIAFVEDVVLPIEAALPSSTPCLARLK